MTNAGAFKLLVGQQSKASSWLTASGVLKTRLSNMGSSGTAYNLIGQFAIPVYQHYRPHIANASNYLTTPARGPQVTPGGTVRFNIMSDGDFLGDMALHIKFAAQTVTISGGVTPTYRWCQYPGERLIQNATFRVQEQLIIDEYNHRDYIFNRIHHMRKEDLSAYKRCVGQEEDEMSEYFQASGMGPTGSRIGGFYRNGFQTPKTSHGAMEMYVPLLFWFCKDYRTPFPSFMAQLDKSVEVTLATADQLVGFEVRGNAVTGSSTLSALTVTQCDLVQNHIYVNEEIKPLLARTFNTTLIRVHKRQDQQVTQPNKSMTFERLKWPCEYLHVAFQPVANEATSNTDAFGTGTGVNHLDHWHILSRITRQSVSGNPLSCLADVRSDSINELNIIGNTIEFYKKYVPMFYNSYLQYKHCGINSTPETGSYLIPFNLGNDTNPTGHINLSHVRGFRIEYDSTTAGTPISTAAPATAIVHSQALNFMQFKSGSVYLHFAT